MDKRQFILWICAMGCLLGFTPVNAVTIDRLVSSILQHHPKIKEAQTQRAQIEQDQDIAAAAFDKIYEQESKFRFSGFFDGQYVNQRLSKRISTFGAQVYTGYRISEGEFPVYEGDIVTHSGGEASIGIAVSLLNGRQTDPFRTALANAQLNQVLGENNEQLALNQVLYDGLSAYLRWYQASLRYRAIGALVTTTQARLEGIRKRVENGDLAGITLTEFQSTLLGRQRALTQVERELILAKRALTFYLRNQNGQMMDVSSIDLAEPAIHWPYGVSVGTLLTLRSQLSHHPLINNLQTERNLAQNEVNLKRNQILPKVDLEYEISNDIGQGSRTLANTENKLALNISVPLGQRKAKAQSKKAELKVSELNFSIQTMQDELKRDMEMAVDDLHYEQSIFQINQKQLDVAQQLFAQEKIRFDSGTSDLFLLNNREALSIEAQLTLIQSQVTLYQKELFIWALAGRLHKL